MLQSSASSMEVFLFLGLPAVIAVIQGVIVYFMKTNKHMPQMQRDLAARQTSRLQENHG
ncbi:hypothetical protein [Herbiconiux ginsengi]|uniref:Uncharacterized protein n=1 Tax=Herbiconiux ginsengi TaxID=381665 RepID=A0A1H3LPR4_9MICO|nr:hypothetical protein [Herbiconiux ginsengi]SDY66547.1 hypothetical protein SAMN05216554_1081 [Herbiconiux ginsengi]